MDIQRIRDNGEGASGEIGLILDSLREVIDERLDFLSPSLWRASEASGWFAVEFNAELFASAIFFIGLIGRAVGKAVLEELDDFEVDFGSKDIGHEINGLFGAIDLIEGHHIIESLDWERSIDMLPSWDIDILTGNIEANAPGLFVIFRRDAEGDLIAKALLTSANEGEGNAGIGTVELNDELSAFAEVIETRAIDTESAAKFDLLVAEFEFGEEDFVTRLFLDCGRSIGERDMGVIGEIQDFSGAIGKGAFFNGGIDFLQGWARLEAGFVGIDIAEDPFNEFFALARTIDHIRFGVGNDEAWALSDFGVKSIFESELRPELTDDRHRKRSDWLDASHGAFFEDAIVGVGHDLSHGGCMIRRSTFGKVLDIAFE